MKLKLNESGQAVLRDGHPVYVQADGKEVAFDAAKATASMAAMQQRLDGMVREVVTAHCSGSRFLASKVQMPSEFVAAALAGNFRMTDGRLVAVDPGSGLALMSYANPGAEPTFEEAVQLLIERHPQRDTFLAPAQSIAASKGQGGASGAAGALAGGTSTPGIGGAGGARRTITRAEFEQLPHSQRGAVLKEAKVVD